MIVAAVVTLAWRHRPGHPLDDPPTYPAAATWGAIGRPVEPSQLDDDGADDDDDLDDDVESEDAVEAETDDTEIDVLGDADADADDTQTETDPGATEAPERT